MYTLAVRMAETCTVDLNCASKMLPHNNLWEDMT